MTMNQLDAQRHSEERGKILEVLAQAFSSQMTSAGSLLRSLDLLGFPISPESLSSHLRYLQGCGYVQVWRTRDMAGWRADRPSPGNPNDARFAALTPRGLQLTDGQIDADPMVRFQA